MAASKKDKMAAAGGVFDKFFTGAPAESAQENAGNDQEAPKAERAGISPSEGLKAESEALRKPKKVFSFRADQQEAASWRAYADARGMKMDQLGAEAFREYLEAHPLTSADQKQIYDIKVRRASDQ